MKHALADLVRNKGANASLMVVLLLSAILMATGAMVMERLVGVHPGVLSPRRRRGGAAAG